MTQMANSAPVGVNRREALACAGAALMAPTPVAWAAPESTARRHLLSERGCGRATGYAEANRIVTAGGKTHVAWLDSPPEGFRVRIKTLDRQSGAWSPTYTIGEAKDNHGGPALTIDSQGYLHIAYYPHHNPFRYRRSRRPHDASEWEDEIQFGERLTYPTLVCGQDDTLYLTARRSFSDRPWQVEMWEKKNAANWRRVGPILFARHKGYAHFQESLAWGSDLKTIHMCCRFHELSDKKSYGRLQTVAYMRSEDLGRSWKRSDGSPLKDPITPDNIEVLERGGENVKRTLRAGCLAVSPMGQPHILFSAATAKQAECWLATPDETGKWRRQLLNESLPSAWRGANLTMAGGLTFDEGGRLHGVAQLQTMGKEPKVWGDPTNEIVAFTRVNDEVIFQAVSDFDPTVSHWLPSIERPTGHNNVGSPGVLYTAGPPGKGNSDLLANRVYFANR